jgi:hypothetical protein
MPRRGRAWASWFQGVPQGTVLLDPTQGQFDRVTSASYQTSASALTIASPDVLRLENRGDGNGALPLIERLVTNWGDTNFGSNFLSTGAGWILNSGATANPGNATGPDGTVNSASTLNLAGNNASAFRRSLGNPNPPANTLVTLSLWILSGRLFAGYIAKDGTTFVLNDWTGTGTWSRFSRSATNSGTNTLVLTIDFQQFTGGTAHSVVLYGYQLETGVYPTSWMPNSAGGGPVQRFPDVLQYTPAQVPYHLRARAWQRAVYPVWSDADLVDGDERWIGSFGSANEGLRFRRAAGATKVEAVSGGVVRAASQALTIARQAQVTVLVRPKSGLVTVNGTPGPAGTAWEWPSGVNYREGGIVTASNELDGRLGPITAVSSTP